MVRKRVLLPLLAAGALLVVGASMSLFAHRCPTAPGGDASSPSPSPAPAPSAGPCPCPGAGPGPAWFCNRPGTFFFFVGFFTGVACGRLFCLLADEDEDGDAAARKAGFVPILGDPEAAGGLGAGGGKN